MATYSLITRQGKGSKLTIEEMDNNLNYLQDLAYGNITNIRSLSYLNSGSNILSSDKTLFIDITQTFYLNLPAPSAMIGKELLFVVTAGNGETSCTLYGNFKDGSYDYIGSWSTSKRYISDGTHWYIV